MVRKYNSSEARKRNPERRSASKKAYYERHKERLRAEARERAARQRASLTPEEDQARLDEKRQRMWVHRIHNREACRYRALNRHRLKYIREHGIAAFRQHFISRVSNVPRGILLEDYDDATLATLV